MKFLFFAKCRWFPRFHTEHFESKQYVKQKIASYENAKPMLKRQQHVSQVDFSTNQLLYSRCTSYSKWAIFLITQFTIVLNLTQSCGEIDGLQSHASKNLFLTLYLKRTTRSHERGRSLNGALDHFSIDQAHKRAYALPRRYIYSLATWFV